MASISFCFLVSAMFRTSSAAVGGAGIFWFLSYCPYFLVFPRYAEISGNGKRMVALFSNTALALGANIITLRESSGEGLTWDNIGERLAEEDDFTFRSVLFMLFLDCILYGLVAWYLDAIAPGQYGIPKPWDFVLEPLKPWLGPCLARLRARIKGERYAPSSTKESIPLLSAHTVRHNSQV